MSGEGKRLEVPIGVDDFKTIRQVGLYFVDKSELISDLLVNPTGAYLFTRPRRFGKSLNLSMLDAFFNLKYKGNNWFDGLKINEHPEVEEYRNTRPVISLPMKDLNYRDYEKFLSDFKDKIKDEYKKFRYLENSENIDPDDRALYHDILHGTNNETLIKKSFFSLCSMLEQYHGVKPIVLLDEYDNTLNHAYGQESFEDILDLLRDFYSRTLKSNEHLGFAVVTGVMQIAKEGIFSGLNNLKVNNIFNVKFDERYGFTNSDVKELCSYYGHPEKFDEAKDWYDGYRFGNAEIYNPWSILKYIDCGFNPDTYWVGTSGNDIIDTLLQNAGEEVFKDLATLGNGGTVVKELTPTVSMDDLKSKRNAIYSVLAVAGYLNAIPTGKKHILSIPNREMFNVFYHHIVEHSFEGEFPYSDLLDALEAGDTSTIKQELDTHYSKFSSLLLADEANYHVIFAAIVFSREGRYEVSIDRESGDGRHDILMKSKFPMYPNIVVEIKKANSEDNETTVDNLAHEALEQIHKKDYCRGLKGKTLLYGIAFKAKTSTVLLEKTTQ